jgi:hypothetical protein
VEYVDLKSGQVKVWKLLRQNRQASAFRHPCPEVMVFTSQGRLKDEKEQCNSGSMDCRLCIKKLLVTYLTYKAFLEVSRTNTCYCDKKRSEWCCVQLLLWFCDCSCYLLATQNVRVCTFGATVSLKLEMSSVIYNAFGLQNVLARNHLIRARSSCLVCVMEWCHRVIPHTELPTMLVADSVLVKDRLDLGNESGLRTHFYHNRTPN